MVTERKRAQSQADKLLWCILSNDEMQILFYLPENALSHCLSTTDLHGRQHWKTNINIHLNTNSKPRWWSLTVKFLSKIFQSSLIHGHFFINKRYLLKNASWCLNPTILTTSCEHMWNPWRTTYFVKCWQCFSLLK